MDVPRETAQPMGLKVIELSHQLWKRFGRIER
jgi:hypothetical protein